VDLTFDNRDAAGNPGGVRPSPDEFPTAGPRITAPPGSNVPSEFSLPTVFAALKKVGLSLAAGRGDVEVLVIDRLERPTEN
jgi:uncharacterized protein (TIGR03435 family)